MQHLLREFQAVPGVVGTLICDRDGRLLSHAFPARYAAPILEEAAQALCEQAAALEAALGHIGGAEFRYSNARVVLRTVAGVRFLLLCSGAVDVRRVQVAIAHLLPRLELQVQERSSARPPAGGALFRLARRIEALIAESDTDADRVRLRGQIAIKAGIVLDVIDPETPDDAAVRERLVAAASAVLGRRLQE